MQSLHLWLPSDRRHTLPTSILHTVCGYARSPFRTFVNLTDKDTLKGLIADKKTDLIKAMKIAQKIYA